MKSTKISCLNKYGCENPFLIKEVKENLKARKDELENKKKQTRLKHFGTDKGWNVEKSLKTRIERYGCAWNQQAVKLTKFKLHGNCNYNNPDKNYATKKANGNMNSSKSEEQSYVFLLTKFNKDDIFRQFKTEKYPFACDFYIKNIDTYIECNYCWTHGGHLFDENNPSDLEKLNKWKAKNTKYYDNAIETWTNRDVLKHKIAKENNLNYLAFWSFDAFESWFATI